jgi:hypothetical protein
MADNAISDDQTKTVRIPANDDNKLGKGQGLHQRTTILIARNSHWN